jgi:hypothetical protein
MRALLPSSFEEGDAGNGVPEKVEMSGRSEALQGVSPLLLTAESSIEPQV